MSMEKIKLLRERTGAGMLDIKEALSSANDDIEKAIEILRKKKLAKVEKKSGNITAEGVIKVIENNGYLYILELNSETDFVSTNEKFVTGFGDILSAISNSNIEGNNIDDYSTVKVNGKSISDFLKDLIGTISENIGIRRVFSYKLKLGENFGIYNHSNKRISSLIISKKKDKELLEDLAMHISAMSPQYISVSKIPKEFIDKEKEIAKEQYKDLKKPDNVKNMIVDNAVNKLLLDATLLGQKFVKEQGNSVSNYIKEDEIIFFKRFEVGEGIEKKENNFAEEVKKQIS